MAPPSVEKAYPLVECPPTCSAIQATATRPLDAAATWVSASSTLCGETETRFCGSPPPELVDDALVDDAVLEEPLDDALLDELVVAPPPLPLLLLLLLPPLPLVLPARCWVGPEPQPAWATTASEAAATRAT